MDEWPIYALFIALFLLFFADDCNKRQCRAMCSTRQAIEACVEVCK